jgi:hypothetical protein
MARPTNEDVSRFVGNPRSSNILLAGVQAAGEPRSSLVPLHQTQVGAPRSSNQIIFGTVPPRASNQANASTLSDGDATDPAVPNWSYDPAKQTLKEVENLKRELPEIMSQYLAIDKALQTLLDLVQYPGTQILEQLATIHGLKKASGTCLNQAQGLSKGLKGLRREYKAGSFSVAGTDFVLVNSAVPLLTSISNLVQNMREGDFVVQYLGRDGKDYAAVLNQRCDEVVLLMKETRWANLAAEIP